MLSVKYHYTELFKTYASVHVSFAIGVPLQGIICDYYYILEDFILQKAFCQ
jgi:hypothetical protein